MGSNDFAPLIADFLRLLADEVERNKSLAGRLSVPFIEYINQNRPPAAPKPTGKTRKKANQATVPNGFDPFLIYYEHGSVGLLSALAEMDAATCKAILSKFGLDPARSYIHWRKPERLADFIVQRVKTMNAKGKVFAGEQSTEAK